MKFTAVTAAGKTLLSSEAIFLVMNDAMHINYVSIIIQIVYLGRRPLSSQHLYTHQQNYCWQFIYEELV
jgi:hypothetical protein